jgi:hypothetical protein
MHRNLVAGIGAFPENRTSKRACVGDITCFVVSPTTGRQ